MHAPGFSTKVYESFQNILITVFGSRILFKLEVAIKQCKKYVLSYLLYTSLNHTNSISKLFNVLHLQIKNSWSKLLFRKYLDYLDYLVTDVMGWYRTSAIFSGGRALENG